MRAGLTALGLLLAMGCGKREPPPSLPQAEARSAQTEEEVAAPTKPTPAFVPADQGSCQRAYRLVDGTCVHRHYEAGNERARASALDQYKRGVAPPMLAPGALARAPDPSPAKKADPGALTRKKAEAEEAAGSAKERRLAELDAMLALAREKLAKREAESKAKQVANAPRKARDEVTKDGPQELEPFARGMNAGGTGATGVSGATASGDAEGARMNELSHITSQLSGDQLKALSEELGKSGFNAGSLEALLNEAQEKPGNR